MARLDLVLADSSSEYCDSVFHYLKNHYDDQFRIDCFTDEALLNQYLNTDGISIDILLISTEFFIKGTINEIHDKVKVIVELKENSETGKSKYRYINKYSNVDDIARKLLDIYADEYHPTNRNIKSEYMRKQAFVVPVCSPEGGSGKTLIATTLAVMYASMGKKPFYLNLEKYYSPAKIFNPSSLRGISDILFYIRNQDTNIGAKINSYKITDPDFGVDYLSPVATPLDLEEMSVQEVICLVKEIISSESYDVILIDTDGSKDFFKPELVKICSKVVIPYTATNFGLSKLRTYISYLEKTMNDKTDVLQKMMILSANKTNEVASDLFERYMKAPVPFPYFNDIDDGIQPVLKHKATKELYNALNICI